MFHLNDQFWKLTGNFVCTTLNEFARCAKRRPYDSMAQGNEPKPNRIMCAQRSRTRTHRTHTHTHTRKPIFLIIINDAR